MTVIAWEGKTLAADRQATTGSTKQSVKKIYATGGKLLGLTGDISVGMEMIDWYTAGADPKLYPQSNRNPSEGCSLIVVSPSGRVEKYESTPHAFEIQGPFAAFGNGADAALAVMHMGGTAARAVEIASQVCSGCGCGLDALEFAQ